MPGGRLTTRLRRGVLAGMAFALGLAAAASTIPGQGMEETPPAAKPAAPKAAPTAQATGPGPGAVRFVNAAKEAGLTLLNRSGSPEKNTINETVGNGVCLADFDDDGWLDIFLPNGQPAKDGPARSALYRARGDGTYEDRTEGLGAALAGFWAQGCVAADYDADGRIDLLVTGFGRYWLLKQTAPWRFTDVTAAAGLAGGRGWSTGAAFADYDGDGWIDLYISHYVDYDRNSPPLPKAGTGPNCMYRGHPVMCGPRGLKPQAGRLFRNLGGRFQDVTATAGMVPAFPGYGLGAVWSDLDDDGDLDLFLATDSTPNSLFRNDHGRFQDVGTTSGIAYSEDGRAQASMGVDAADYDNDGRIDLVTTNFSHDYTTVYHNEGGLLFLDVALDSGVGPATMPSLGWGVDFVDVDGDGRKDLFEANGHVYPGIDALNLGTTWAQASQLFWNQGDGRFREITSLAGPGFAEKHSARGSAVGDLDNDGDPDIVVNNMDETPSLLRNVGPRGRWIGFRLQGGRKNRAALGAKVTVVAAGLRQVEEVHAGSSHNSSGDTRLLFGLGTTTGPVQAEIRWPSGRTQNLKDLAPGRYHTVAEPSPPR
ncbi:MAG TPA: CRTAC1 family protein [Candidatus Polarisedimenticolia bacterium]|nr:CRTAC1 family protein [Candidatus Polarisedimenticolia bacterium]